MTYTLADIIVSCIISAGIGYFWAIYRADNIKLNIKTFNNHIKVDAKEFWQQAEEWKARQVDKNTEAVPK